MNHCVSQHKRPTCLKIWRCEHNAQIQSDWQTEKPFSINHQKRASLALKGKWLTCKCSFSSSAECHFGKGERLYLCCARYVWKPTLILLFVNNTSLPGLTTFFCKTWKICWNHLSSVITPRPCVATYMLLLRYSISSYLCVRKRLANVSGSLSPVTEGKRHTTCPQLSDSIMTNTWKYAVCSHFKKYHFASCEILVHHNSQGQQRRCPLWANRGSRAPLIKSSFLYQSCGDNSQLHLWALHSFNAPSYF